MPVQQCKSDGKSGYKWGSSGKCYTYVAGDRRSVKMAKKKAEKQGRAIEASKDES